MKKDRNCMGYPVYPQMIPNFNGMVMPGEMIPMPGNYMMNVPQTSNSSSDINTLTNQINSLEQRVRRLENIVNNGTGNYNSSNYQMM